MEDLKQEVEVYDEVEDEELVDGEIYDDEASSKGSLLGVAIGVGLSAGAAVLYKKAIKPGFNWAKGKVVEKIVKAKEAEEAPNEPTEEDSKDESK